MPTVVLCLSVPCAVGTPVSGCYGVRFAGTGRWEFPNQKGESSAAHTGEWEGSSAVMNLTTTVSILIFRFQCPFPGWRSGWLTLVLVVEGCPLSITTINCCLCRRQLWLLASSPGGWACWLSLMKGVGATWELSCPPCTPHAGCICFCLNCSEPSIRKYQCVEMGTEEEAPSGWLLESLLLWGFGGHLHYCK